MYDMELNLHNQQLPMNCYKIHYLIGILIRFKVLEMSFPLSIRYRDCITIELTNKN